MIMVLNVAAYGGAADLPRQHHPRPFTASPDLTVTITGLAAFGGINAEQANPITRNIQSITINDTRLPFQGQRPDRGRDKGKDKNKQRTND